MSMDIVTVTVLTAFVVNISGVVFIVETLMRRDDGPGATWALGFLAAMVTTLAYIVWAQEPEAWWAVAVGNASFVIGTGCMWLGCRRFNGRRMLWPGLLVLAAGIAAFVSVLAAGPAGGDWAGALWMFGALMLFAAFGAVECLRGELGTQPSAWALSGVLALQSLFYVSRTTAFLTSGPDSALFASWFGTVTASFLTIGLTIVAVVVLSVLRAQRTQQHWFERPASFGASRDGILAEDDFDAALDALCTRAAVRSELVSVVSVRVEDIAEIATAFGGEVAATMIDETRAAVRRHAPSMALVAEDGGANLLVAAVAAGHAEARRQASVLHRAVFDAFTRLGGIVIPVVGVGVGLSESEGYDADALERTARAAAARSSGSVGATVVVGDEEGTDQPAAMR